MLIPKAANCLKLNSKIWKLVNSYGVVKQQFYHKEMSDSEKYVFLTLRQSGLETLLNLLPRQIFVSGVRQVTLQARLFAGRRWTAWLRGS